MSASNATEPMMTPMSGEKLDCIELKQGCGTSPDKDEVYAMLGEIRRLRALLRDGRLAGKLRERIRRSLISASAKHDAAVSIPDDLATLLDKEGL